MRQRGQIAIAAIGGLTAVLLGTVVLLHLSRIAAGGAGAQTAADMAALAAARTLASDPLGGAGGRASGGGVRRAGQRRATGRSRDRARRSRRHRRRRDRLLRGRRLGARRRPAARHRPRAGAGRDHLHGGAAGRRVPAGRPARRARPARRCRGRRGAGGLALRLGRREPGRGRVRLLRADRLRLHGGRPSAAGPPDRGRPVASRSARAAGRARRPATSSSWAPPRAPRITSACTSEAGPSSSRRTPAPRSGTSPSPRAGGTATAAWRGRRRAARRPTRASSGRRASTRCRRTSSRPSSTSASPPIADAAASALAAAAAAPPRRPPGRACRRARRRVARGGRSAARLRRRARGRRGHGPAAADERDPEPQAASQSAMRVEPLRRTARRTGGGNRSWLGRRVLEVGDRRRARRPGISRRPAAS